jgi:hypothetical protein
LAAPSGLGAAARQDSREVTRSPKTQEGADSRQHLPPGVQRCSARAARLQLPASLFLIKQREKVERRLR